MHLMSDALKKGLHVPMKLVTGINPDGTIAADKFVPKVASEYIHKRMRRKCTKTRRP